MGFVFELSWTWYLIPWNECHNRLHLGQVGLFGEVCFISAKAIVESKVNFVRVSIVS